MRRVLENTPSKHKQLGRSLCIIVILSLHCTGVVLALFQVLAFDRLYLDTLNNICYHICVYIRWTNYFKFNVFFTCCCYVWVMFLLFATFFALLLVIVANINISPFSFDASSKSGLRFTIAIIRLGSISLKLSKVISFSILFCEFRVFVIILDNSIKNDLHFFILNISRIQPSFTFRVALNVFFFYKLIFWNFNHYWEKLV